MCLVKINIFRKHVVMLAAVSVVVYRGDNWQKLKAVTFFDSR